MWICTKIENGDYRQQTIMYAMPRERNDILLRLLDIDTHEEKVINLDDINNYDILGKETVSKQLFTMSYSEYLLSTCLEYIGQDTEVLTGFDPVPEGVVFTSFKHGGLYGGNIHPTIMRYIIRSLKSGSQVIEINDSQLVIQSMTNTNLLCFYKYRILDKALFTKVTTMG